MSTPKPIVLSGMLSKNSRYSLYIEGPFGSREINNLKRFLDLQLEWALEDEAAEALAAAQGDDAQEGTR